MEDSSGVSDREKFLGILHLNVVLLFGGLFVPEFYSFLSIIFCIMYIPCGSFL
jgi:hypothetical protein